MFPNSRRKQAQGIQRSIESPSTCSKDPLFAFYGHEQYFRQPQVASDDTAVQEYVAPDDRSEC
eukprot:609190-Pyramimonas_sp.AAC.1